MNTTRRTIISILGLALPIGLGTRRAALASEAPPAIRLRPFEESVRAAFAGQGGDGRARGIVCRRIEVGDSDLVRAGLQGCQNDRPFAGFAEGALRIVRTGFEPGPSRAGTRLYVATVDIVLASTLAAESPGRPLDFSALPPAPTFA